MDFVQLDNEGLHAELLLRHFVRVNLLLTSAWVDQFKFLISVTLNIKGNKGTAEGFY